MLIRKIINDNKDRMQMFKQSADKFGFVEHIENMVSEFKRYCLTPEELAIHANLAASDPTLQAKFMI